ncbi:transglutaminase-like domain-containing protein [Microbacterium sp. CFBP9034]|uniref:transglutaminase-like domain-containing protein n=1 Tax=Microbacterium sp. CFBP9034 TaxID=3096540 RepID=UPI002A6AFA27|nr:transglutaminase-like domain-containing protein [Microbacterium sp. CFBP9034]MDY0910317.1 transglutaminase-like domain-containing protein [Microbacterium sp. CFBP9034]
MTRATDAARSADRPRRFVPRIAAGAALAAVVVVTAAVAAWPIYRSWHLTVLVAASVLVAAAIAAVAWRRRWSGWLVAGVLAAAFLLIGVPLAVPSRLGAPADLLRGLGELSAGALLAWKDLVTVELPVGAYRNLLVPALIVFLVGTCAVLLLSWREDRTAYGAVPVALGMVSFGLFFGRTTVSAPLSLGPVVLYAPVETALGVASLLACLLWLAWRTHEERVQALQRAAASSGVRISRRPSRADRRRTALGAGMVAVALVLAVAVVPFAARGAERDVLRTAVEPEIDLSASVSPLAEYRALFADGRADEVLFAVSSGESLPSRVRLATLDAYDGEVFRSGGEGAVDAGRFVRVPSLLDAGAGTPVEAEIAIDGLQGIWMPTVGRLASVEFAGDRAASLADRFYYNSAAAAGVQTAGGGLTEGDRYVVDGVEPAAPDLAEIEAPGGVSPGVAAPESLRAWMDEHASGTGGAALAELVGLLRERGYLSHGLAQGKESPEWAEALADYAPQPSASGHSLARVDTMFARLLERETDPRAEASGNYVAAVGDDEQFAVAVALIARELGFPSRVVLGARLGESEPGLAACDGGVCRAQDLTAWTEVQSSAGEWVPIDVTPQYAQSPSLDVTEQRDPEVVTEVRPDSVEEVVPPEPVQEDSAAGEPDDAAVGPDLAWLWPVLRTAGVVVLVLGLAFGPFLVIIGAKAARRRSRRRAGAPAVRIAGGWDEFVDAAVDARREAPRTHTRRELAASFESEAGLALAETADRAVFSSTDVTATDAEEYWRAVEVQRRVFARERGFWRGLAVTVSLRSFVRHLAPASGARTRFAERGKRRAPQPARSMP